VVSIQARRGQSGYFLDGYVLTTGKNKKIFGIIIMEELCDEIREKDIAQEFKELKNEMIYLNISHVNIF